ncbi:uncharacterized protein LOC114297545 [Camellia sinensis]|uniref:uncharacterized protein LOC114297545 n=1 Tax=Camellia sinensis TaxID=4442 RepID=UPI0010366A0C|nr:uncharacterized protein LOC114297545 [Camellia sinensis]
MFTSFSSSSSSCSSDDESNDEYMVTLLGAYEMNNASMLQILQSSDSSKKIGGSDVGHKYIRRNRRQGHERLFADYFVANPVYSPTMSSFVSANFESMRILSYGVVANAVDDYIRIEESTAIQSLQQFCNLVIEIIGPEYLRSLTPTDITRLLAIGKVQGFPSKAPPVHYTINGHSYNMGYYLADSIYPQWATLVQTISSPQGAKKQHFTMMQESAMKDVERAFGVLQSRFVIIGGAVRFWDSKMLANIMKSCIILHNMIVEDEREEHLDFNYELSSTNAPVQLSSTPTNDF